MKEIIKGVTIEKRIETRGRKPKLKMEKEPEIITFDNDKKLSKLDIDPIMLEMMESGKHDIDQLVSYEGGLPRAANYMIGGGEGVGKTTVFLDYISGLQKLGQKVVFISLEMGKIGMYKYLQRFPHLGQIETLFGADYLDFSLKNVIEQKFALGYDVILIDSIAELLSAVRDEEEWDKRQVEKWFVKLCVRNNNGENKAKKYTSFLGIQQLNVSNGEFVGGGKLRYLFDSTFKLIKDKESGQTYIISGKNRHGKSGEKLYYELKNNKIIYSGFINDETEEDE